ncbi:hypothetical protein Cgig2_003279 [Carnegiea gigantea]|uniref:Uncharacterized protein n=1 Tax=Carnegiea gigantea TaxID=171969 RepID=A0A9Q1GN17_9CARY|nr:hypothetical protein Cgig2_003279 [Carnegiea gigantea]
MRIEGHQRRGMRPDLINILKNNEGFRNGLAIVDQNRDHPMNRVHFKKQRALVAQVLLLGHILNPFLFQCHLHSHSIRTAPEIQHHCFFYTPHILFSDFGCLKLESEFGVCNFIYEIVKIMQSHGLRHLTYHQRKDIREERSTVPRVSPSGCKEAQPMSSSLKDKCSNNIPPLRTTLTCKSRFDDIQSKSKSIP